MIHIEFSEQEKRALDYERYHHPHPHVQRKMEALWLKSQKLPHKDICRCTGISKHTLCTYLQSYKQGGLAWIFHKKAQTSCKYLIEWKV